MEDSGGDYGKERPDSRHEEGEGEGADEGGLEIGRVTDVAEAGADRAGDALGGKRGLEERSALPVDEHPDDSGEGDGVEQEDPGGARLGAFEGGYHESAECWAGGAGEVVAGGVERDGLGGGGAGDGVGDEGLPCRVV